jgi:hypothetical protein
MKVEEARSNDVAVVALAAFDEAECVAVELAHDTGD